MWESRRGQNVTLITLGTPLRRPNRQSASVNCEDAPTLRGLRGSFLNLLQSLWFVPGLIAVAYGVLAVVLVEIDKRAEVAGGPLFEGDGPAARTLLSVIAGSLITVAGLTFSITVVVLQLTSSQFSPRILRTFFGDRVTQVTVGSYVGIFVYSIVVLRSVGGVGAFVPRLAVTVASALAIAAVVLLIVFIHHVSQLIQVSHVTGDITARTLGRLEALYPARHGEAAEELDAESLLAGWSVERPGLVLPRLPGFVQRIELDDLAAGLPEDVERAAVLVRPGDFVSVEQPLVAVWPAASEARSTAAVRRTCRIERERDLDEDVDFGLRQLVDTAVKAMSPGINDPTTACTCVGYVRSILVRLVTREFPQAVRRYPERALTVAVRRREFEEYLDSLTEIGRYSQRDARVTAALLDALRSVSGAAREAGGEARAAAAVDVALAIGLPAREAASNRRDRELIDSLLDALRQHALQP